MKRKLNSLNLFIVAVLFVAKVNAQFFNVPVSGFTQDVVADGVGLPNTSTSFGVDGAGQVLIDPTFNPDGSGACVTGALPASNTITSTNITTNTGITYTLQPYNANNSLQVTSASTTGTL